MKIRPRLRRPGYAEIAATLALVVSLGGTTYAVSTLAPNSVTTQMIQNGAVTRPKIAANAINGSRVADESISLSDLLGANGTGTISFSLGANACGTLNFGVSGAAIGQAVIMSYTGTMALPPGVVFSPFRVTSAGHVEARGCNVTGTPVSVSGLGIRFVTFG